MTYLLCYIPIQKHDTFCLALCINIMPHINFSLLKFNRLKIYVIFKNFSISELGFYCKPLFVSWTFSVILGFLNMHTPSGYNQGLTGLEFFLFPSSFERKRSEVHSKSPSPQRAQELCSVSGLSAYKSHSFCSCDMLNIENSIKLATSLSSIQKDRHKSYYCFSC